MVKLLSVHDKYNELIINDLIENRIIDSFNIEK
ncbi:hypothetical protein MTsPCn9_06810 [Croceitalea sp. MTPC9]|nr:hypothetical protein MTsPCn6_01900 [Croceitalea sp. MTPC6]GMN15745.1 hypothetical protein MTsPCn9_06810 [Croceitalea sp. MTPC9]